jgi:hypothetical protein
VIVDRQRRRAHLKSIAELLGHTSARMTERYAHASRTHLHALAGHLARAKTSAASNLYSHQNRIDGRWPDHHSKASVCAVK